MRTSLEIVSFDEAMLPEAAALLVRRMLDFLR